MMSDIKVAGVQQLIEAHGKLSLSSDDLTEEDHLRNLALQVLHGLKHQHRWTGLKLHTRSPLAPYGKLPRPMLSGLPPRRLYIHPDEQMEHLKLQDQRKKRRAQSSSGSTGGAPTQATKDDDELPPVREWVLPTHIREKWSLKRMASAFDAISILPPDPAADDQNVVAEGLHADPDMPVDKWRTKKRLLFATVDDDSTITYYIVHDGIVKPRQN